MNQEKAVTGIYEGIREKLTDIRKDLNALEVMALSLEVRESMDRKDAEPLFVRDPEEEEITYDFEGEGILCITPEGDMAFLTCREADSRLDEMQASPGIWAIDGTSFVAAFNADCAKEQENGWLVAGELLVFASNGEKIRPLTTGEVCDICRYLDENKHENSNMSENRNVLVLR